MEEEDKIDQISFSICLLIGLRENMIGYGMHAAGATILHLFGHSFCETLRTLHDNNKMMKNKNTYNGHLMPFTLDQSAHKNVTKIKHTHTYTSAITGQCQIQCHEFVFYGLLSPDPIPYWVRAE